MEDFSTPVFSLSFLNQKMTDGETWTGNALFRLSSRAPASGSVCLISVRTVPCGTGRPRPPAP